MTGGNHHSGGNVAATDAARRQNLYETPWIAVSLLLNADSSLPQNIWDPCCGRGAIVRVLEDWGHDVAASDIDNFGADVRQAYWGVDFLATERAPSIAAPLNPDEAIRPQGETVRAIVTNPPYSRDLSKFIAHALALCPVVCLLLRLDYYANGAVCDPLLGGGHLRHIYGFDARFPPMRNPMPEVRWDVPKAKGSIDFAWFIWDQAHCGPTTISRLPLAAALAAKKAKALNNLARERLSFTGPISGRFP